LGGALAAVAALTLVAVVAPTVRAEVPTEENQDARFATTEVAPQPEAGGEAVPIDPDSAPPAPAPGRSPYILTQPRPVPPFPIVLNQTVQHYVTEFLDHSDQLQGVFDRTRPYVGAMMRELRDRGLPDDLVYLSFAESAFSPRGKGPWQFTAATAKKYHLKIDRWIDERRDPILSTRAAAEYLAELHDAAGYDWNVALIGWNAGEYKIQQYWSLRGENFGRKLERLPARTRQLVGRFMAVAFIAHNARAYGITAADYDEPPAYREVEVKGGMLLARLAVHFHTTVAQLKTLNPALLRDRIPPNAHSYTLRIPVVTSASID
jgi:membrane-bound lytic murein transglycosylase D